jgi:cytidylate kinase
MSSELEPEGLEFIESLRQAFARQMPPRGEGEFQPPDITVCISRETGSRGATIAQVAAKKLGWQVYDQEFLEYVAQERHQGRDMLDALDDDATRWVDAHMQRLLRQENLSQNSHIMELARVILAIGARGAAVIIGRGASCILPVESALLVRIVAPLADRIQYLSQLERLTPEIATEQVRLRDAQRDEFVTTHFHRSPGDVYQYDLVINSGLLGEDASAQMIVLAAKCKRSARELPAPARLQVAPEEML